MEKIDARAHNQQTQHELRKQVVRLRKRGLPTKETGELVGISASHASTIWQKYLRGGIEAIKPGKRSRRHGAQRVLNAEQEKDVQVMLVDKAPNQLKLPFALWTRDAVRLATKKKFDIELPLRAITDYLKRWGFTPQNGQAGQVYEQDPKKLKQWLEHGYPEIASRAKKERAEIHWGDQIGVNNARGFTPKGQTPIYRAAQCEKKQYQHALVDNQRG